jgi:predicted enzyme related to lactoylglutathione lyase
MEKVLGIGGIFFRAKDPAALSDWYAQHLGVNPAPTDMEMVPWKSTEGVVVFAPFAADTDYFPADKQAMVNFRVADLDRMLDQLRAADIAISHEMTIDGIGRFARIHDPEGNPIELWQPAS